MNFFPVVNGQSRHITEQLTSREKEVFYLLLEGFSTGEIAKCLGLASTTVSTHKIKLMEKLHVNTEAQLVLLAVANNLIDLHPAHRHLESLLQLAA